MRLQRAAPAVAVVFLVASAAAVSGHARHADASRTPIKHVIYVMMENRSFDNVLGALCAERVNEGDPAPCDGAKAGELLDGSMIPLTAAPDVQPPLSHSVESHRKGLNYTNGVAEMNGFRQVPGCQAVPERHHWPYACYDQYDPEGPNADSIANITMLANQFAISDRTFESYTSASWTSHLEMVAGTRDGFHGDNPHYHSELNPPPHGPGAGCTSNEDAPYDSPTQGVILVPSCVPDRNGDGPYRDSPVAYVPTIFDRLDAAGISYKVYHTLSGFRSPCSYFWECANSKQATHTVPEARFMRDAAAGELPAVSFLMPPATESQHPGYSMMAGDNWIGQVVQAIQNGSPSQWDSTALFLSYDDCGCFYDHVAPPVRGMGIRVPMLIVSPYARPHFVDHGSASLASPLAFIESNWGLAPLGNEDTGAYDFGNAFDYSQAPLGPEPMRFTPLPKREVRYLRLHPGRFGGS